MANEEKKIKNRVNRQVAATSDGVDKFLLSLGSFLQFNLNDILKGLKDGKVRGVEAAAQLGGLLTELDKRGLKKEIGGIKEIFAKELRFIADEFEEQGITDIFSGSDKQTVNALINVQLSKTDLEIKRYGVNIQAAVMNQVIAGKDIGVILAKNPPKEKLGWIRSEINTAVMAFNRTITASKAEELGLNLFLYTGPDDDVTRPFCDHLLDRNPAIYTKEEIDRMDNKQGLSVMTYGGGYNCRHHWRAISKELAEQLGYEN